MPLSARIRLARADVRTPIRFDTVGRPARRETAPQAHRATTEGYASQPGGAQAELLAEVNKHEAERNLDLVWTEFRNYQQGILPAGPGARELREFFAHVDGNLPTGEAGSPKIQRSDREVLNLLT